MEKTIHIEIRFTRAAALALLSLTLVLGAMEMHGNWSPFRASGVYTG